MVIVYGLLDKQAARLAGEFAGRVRFWPRGRLPSPTAADVVVLVLRSLGHSECQRAMAVFGRRRLRLVKTGGDSAIRRCLRELLTTISA